MPYIGPNYSWCSAELLSNATNSIFATGLMPYYEVVIAAG